MTGSLRNTLGVLSAPGQVVEVRALAENGTDSGYFTDYEALARQVEALDCDPSVHGCYITLNEVNPALLARRANRIKMHLRGDATTSDADIIRRRWLPIDIDPVRPSGVSSTDAEHGLALAKADEIAAWLSGIGFPEPVRGDSGNGAHLLYRIDLPNDEAATKLVKAVLSTLDALFSDTGVSVDTANYNAGRIWKLYGTMVRKGDSTSERPHRRSRLVSAPHDVVLVTVEQLQNLAAQLPAEPDTQPAVGKEPALDLRSWLVSHGIAIRHEKPYRGGTLFTLAQCPFSSAHKDGAYAIQFANGAIHAACHHATCDTRKQRWKELREKYETPAEKHERQERRIKEWSKERAKGKANPGSTLAKTPDLLPDDDPEPPEFTEEHTQKALEILEHGDPRAFILATYSRVHVGDELVGECYLASFLSSSITNSRGLHCCPTGDSGKGKSDSAKGFLKMVPRKYKIQGSITSKALFYHKIPEGSVIIFDDFEMSEDLREVLKNATSDFHVPLQHLSLNTNREPITLHLPPRCVWWILSVDNPGDDQVLNRMLVPWIDDSEVQDRRVKDRVFSMAENDGDNPDSIEDLCVIRAILSLVRKQRFFVRIPYARRITMENLRNRRNPIMLLDMIRSFASLAFMQRPQRILADGTIQIDANEQDFLVASRLFTSLDSTGGSQTSKLLKSEKQLIDTVLSMKIVDYTISDLQKWMGFSHQHLFRILHGRNDHDRNRMGGLLSKCPALGYIDTTITDQTGENVRRKRENHYTFSQELYQCWNRGSSVRLDTDPKGSIDPDGPAPAGDGRVMIGCSYGLRSKDAEKTANDNPALLVQDNSTNGTIITRESESMCGTTIPAVVCTHDAVCSYGLGAMGDDNSKTKIVGENQKIPEPGGNLLNPNLNPNCTQPGKPGAMAGTSGTIPLPGILDFREFRKVDPALFGRCDVCSVNPVSYRDDGTHTSLCSECYGRLVREGKVSGQISCEEPGRSGLAAEQNGGKV
ncbi:MAG: hypothetical protein STSR0009_31230 [Methanoregula sp.]